MSADTGDQPTGHPVLLCFDGSDDAATAIAQAAELLAPRPAVVLTVWEPVATWEPYDPATILSAPVSKLLSEELGIDEIAAELAEEKVKQGVALASSAGFAAQGRVAHGKTWRTICDVAGEIDAAAIVLGARGLSRMGSLLLGSVSFAVTVHANRPVLVVPHHGGGQGGGSLIENPGSAKHSDRQCARGSSGRWRAWIENGRLKKLRVPRCVRQSYASAG